MEFKRGDFVKLKKGPTGTVGVVWEIHSQKTASVEVYWSSGTGRVTQDHESRELEIVPPNDAPDYALNLKRSMGL